MEMTITLDDGRSYRNNRPGDQPGRKNSLHGPGRKVQNYDAKGGSMKQKKDNSIINSLMRLKRAGAENSKTTQKLKESVEEVAGMLDKIIYPLISWGRDYPKYTFYRIIGKLYYTNAGLIWDHDEKADLMNINNYLLCPKEEYVRRECALSFSKAIAEGLLDEIREWVEKETEKNNAAILKIAEKATLEDGLVI